MAMSSVEILFVSKFNLNLSSCHLGQEWVHWQWSFQLYAMGKGVMDAAQKRALLLHCDQLEVQDVFFTLKEEAEEGEDAYQKCVRTLKKHFTPKMNIPYKWYEFKNLRQEQSESIEQFTTRLRLKSVHCQFDKPEEAIRDQVIEKCLSHRLRAKLLEKHELPLDQVRLFANTMELGEMQSKYMEGVHTDVSVAGPTVNTITGKKQLPLR